jgi:PKD repeat protein
MEWDSSAYFTNATSPLSSTNKYLWNFGDGSATSTDVNPFHTFPAFNTYYIVCLTAINSCGSPSYCDTVWIDSMHIGGSFKVIAVRHSERSEESDASYLSKTKASNSTNNQQLSTNQLSKSIRPINHH